ncbi:MAG: tetratricopeptide repeat protein [Candidatus Omnitrophota bacterium]|nr:MAG: tetratricopeptide repeat protein [Candidatus Omnitrophota bacterium]
MSKVKNVDLDKERKLLDREITFFHFKRASKKIVKCLHFAEATNNEFFIWYFKGQECILEGDFREAIKYFNRALKIRPKDGCTYNDKALCLAELGKQALALECFNEGIKKDRDCASLYHNKGWLLHSLERYQQALLCFQKALELEGNRAESLFSLADTYFKLGNIEKARKFLELTLSRLKGKSSYVRRETLKRLRKLKDV